MSPTNFVSRIISLCIFNTPSAHVLHAYLYLNQMQSYTFIILHISRKSKTFSAYKPKIPSTSDYGFSDRGDDHSIYQHLHIMHKIVQLVDSLVYMPVAEVPCLIVQHLFDGVQPVFSAVIHSGLVYSRQEALCWNILIWAGV